MREIKANDVIFHFIDNKALVGVSKAKSSADTNFAGLKGTEWSDTPSYRIDLEGFTKLSHPIERGEFLQNPQFREQLSKILNEHNGLFFNKNFELNQGAYLTEAPIELVEIWNRIYKLKTGGHSLPCLREVDELGLEQVISIDNKIDTVPSCKLFLISDFADYSKNANLKFPEMLPYRFTSALLTKPFVILTGLSGSGKTKLAEAFTFWISEDSVTQICMIPVGADWTNREPLLGYPNALETGKYVKLDCCVIDLIIHAINNKDLPHFLILDEMNMSHVERYFADFLSAMESSGRQISLHPDAPEWKNENGDWNDGVPAKIELPKNLFIIGTVNIDETTYMFSPKVLDRAQVIEFRVSKDEMEEFLASPAPVDMDKLKGFGAAMGADFVARAREAHTIPDDLKDKLLPFFEELELVGAEFGYRTAAEIARFISICGELSAGTMSPADVVDAAVMQKLLPKLHGSRNRIEKKLKKLAQLCLEDSKKEPFKDDASGPVIYKLSYNKLKRMYDRVITDGFTSYAEA